MAKGPKIYLVTQGDKKRLIQADKMRDVINFLAKDATIQELGSVDAAAYAQTIKLEKAGE